ncbi:DUF7127 family protein [Haloarchaeobius amylolyticus]|uniref:DUF7127 family protein n=1 Tax=Haloarchaeobius amylolyticus TaxID=1198296 RepID=UPI002271051F|nr:Hsp20/alpha crystallin family protein [Haloarchaeobius amylolyticus]
MHLQEFVSGSERFVRHYAYDDVHVIAADLGALGSEATVDVAGDTVIVVPSDDHDQFEIEVPGTARAFIRNGILTIEMEVDA